MFKQEKIEIIFYNIFKSYPKSQKSMHSFLKYQAAQNQKKRQTFQKQIRSSKMSKYFKDKRKMFFAPSSQEKTFSSISSIQHLQSLLQNYSTTGSNVNFLEINSFIIGAMNDYFPEQVQRQLIEIFFSSESYLSDVISIASIVNLINRQKFNIYLARKELFDLVIDKLIPANQKNSKKQINMGEQFLFIQNCQLICLLLQILYTMIGNQVNFQQLSRFYKDIQNSCNIFSSQYISMISKFSTNSNLLPSQRVIQQYLTIKIEQSRTQKELYDIVDVLQNYIRFTQKENVEVILGYLKFISNCIYSGNFPHLIKQQMINLFTSLINSSSEVAFNQIFKNEHVQKIFNSILTRAKFGTMPDQTIPSLVAISRFVQRLSKQQLNQILQYYPSVLTVLIEWLQIQDQETVLQILLALNSILEKNPKSSQQMFNACIIQKFNNLMMRSQNKPYQISQYIHRTYFLEYEKL